MTGRELIIHILQNNLQDEVIFENGLFVNLITETEFAARCNVGVETVKVWRALHMISGIKIGETVYFLSTIKDPRIIWEAMNND